MANIQYRECYKEHLKLIIPYSDSTPGDGFDIILENSLAFSFWFGVRCVGAAGLLRVYPTKCMGWALLSKASGPHMTELTRKIKSFLDQEPTERIEILVQSDFKLGHKWARLLGFKCETPEGMKKHGVNGADEYLYARVK